LATRLAAAGRWLAIDVEGSVPMIGIGFIGAGMIGQLAHISNFADMPGCKIRAIAELRPELGRQAAERFQIERVYPSHKELLADPAIDAVVVVTRRGATGPIVRDALNAGKHVLSEKPMAPTHELAQSLVDAAVAARRKYAVGFMKRHDAGVQRAKMIVDELRESRELGSIVLIRVYCFGGEFLVGSGDFAMTEEVRPEGLELWPQAPDWVPQWLAADYAWFLNVFVHDLNLLRFFAGKTPQVTAVDLHRPNGRLVLFDFGDFPGVLEMAEVDFREWQEGVEVLFEKGRLRVELPPPLLRNVPARIELTYAGDRKDSLRPDVPWSWAFRRQAEAFITDVATNREPIASGKDSLEDMVLAEWIWQRHLV
jgi:predicted dehydrogenase